MARKMNYDAAKRREWKAEARRERAMERRHEAIAKQAEWEQRGKGPASLGQISLMRKYKMHAFHGHGEELYETLTMRQASEMIDAYFAANPSKNWKPKKKKQTKKIDTRTYKPWLSSDVKVTNIKTGETFIEKNRQKH